MWSAISPCRPPLWATCPKAGSCWARWGVLPARQRQGIGSALVREALDQAREQGASGVVLVGDPGFYGRFGFRAFEALSYATAPAQYILALPFTDRLPKGEITPHSAFC